jgi:hypothetical protein
MNLSQTVQLTRLGKIHLGIRVPVTKDRKNENCRKANHPTEEMCMYCSRPVQTDYFVFGPPEAYPPGIHAQLIEAYGEKPKELKFFFPTESRPLVFPQALKFYKGPRLWCRGDGLQASRIDDQTGGQFSVKCPCEFLGNGCAPRASLMIALYKVRVQGCFQIDTGSIHNIIRTNSFFNELAGDPIDPYSVSRSLLQRISYAPLSLSLVKQPIMTPEGKSVEKPMWVFMFDGDARQAAMLRQRDAISALLPGQPELPALPPAPDDRHDEVEDQEGPMLDGRPLTPPDQAEPETVDLETGEVTGGPSNPPPGPGPDPKPDAPPVDLSKSTKPEDGEAPFEEPEAKKDPPPEPEYPWANHLPQDASGIVQTMNAIKGRDEFDAFKVAVTPILEDPKKVKPGMRKAVEHAITEKQAELY